jgi:HTH-type transcriptional regulator/antitoxin HipB
MNILVAKDLGALIRDRRNELGITQEELAEQVGVSRVWIVAVEKGKSSAQVDLVLRTVRQLGLVLRVDAVAPAPAPQGIDLAEVIRSHTKKE